VDLHEGPSLGDKIGAFPLIIIGFNRNHAGCGLLEVEDAKRRLALFR
jgi:hypothetical protein